MRLASGSSSRARRRVLGLGVVVAVGMLVAGCTGEEPVEPEPSTSTAEESAEPTEEPEPSPTETGPVKPERPAAMEQEDAEGAAAAAEYFIELYDYVMITGDVSEWKAMAHESCGFCAKATGQSETINERSDVFAGGSTTAQLVEAFQRDEATGIFPLDMQVEQAAISIEDSSGATVYSSDAISSLYRVEMGLRQGEWVVVEIAPSPEV